MVIQAYSNGYAAIFKGKKQICRFTVFPPAKSEVDKHLKRLRMKRKTKWKEVDWGSEASVQFIPEEEQKKGERR